MADFRLQNIPIRTETGRRIQGAFARRVLPSNIDYATLELTLMKKLKEQSSEPTFKDLTPEETRVFGCICIGEDDKHDDEVLRALLDKGYITPFEKVRTIRRPVTAIEAAIDKACNYIPKPVTGYECATPSLHMEWCQWCSTVVRIEDEQADG